jgi:hypothetical protein
MRFLCLIAADRWMETMPEEETAPQYAAYARFTDQLRDEGRLVACERLQPPETAKTVRVRSGRAAVTDGPFAETKELIGGFYLLEAEDIDEAVAIASRIPGAAYGCVEVRPVAEDAQTLRALGALDVEGT